MTETGRHIPIGNFSDFRNETDTDNGSAWAARYFAAASRKHPASTTAQAAYIAQLCKTSGNRNPIALMKSVLRDTEKLGALANAATAMHAAHRNGPKDAEGVLEPVSPEQVRITIEQDFLLAAWMMVLSDNQLDQVLGLYPHYLDLNHAGYGRNAETEYRIFAQGIIQKQLASDALSLSDILSGYPTRTPENGK